MKNPATHVTEKFRKEVEEISKDKVQGNLVRHYRALFSPSEIIEIRSTLGGNRIQIMTAQNASAPKIVSKKPAKKKRRIRMVAKKRKKA